MNPPLGDYFPKESKIAFLENNLTLGAVFKILSEITNPPKEKFVVIIGVDNDKAVVGHLFINSKINIKIAFSPELRSMHLSLSQDQYSFLKHDSYLDCSNIQEIDKNMFERIINNNLSAYQGALNQPNIDVMKYMITKASTIPLKIKKRYGYY